MRRFLIGALVGGLLMHIYIQYGGEWYQVTSGWFGKAASDYRGDRHQQRAREALQ